jgi:hypothetical protein
MHDVQRGKQSREALAKYEAGRQAEWRRLLGANASLIAGDAGDRWLAPFASRLLACIPESGDRLERLATQLGLRLVTQ